MKKLLFLSVLVAISACFACNKDDKQAEKERALIVADLAAKNLTATEDPSGIFYIIDTPGDSTHPNINSRVKVNYKGYLLNGQVFDQSTAPVNFYLYQLIEGWQICIPLLGKGGHGTFWIPSKLGYGSNSQPGIPGNSTLVFEIGLVDFQ